MEAALLHSYVDHGSMYSPCKRVRNPKRSTQTRSYNTNSYHSEGLPKVEMMVPLIPRPIPPPQYGGSRGNSPSPAHKKHNKGNKYSSKQYLGTKPEPCVVVGSSTERLGPDPDCLPKDIKKVLFVGEEEKFSGSASFALAPPSSSLPMPKFSLKPKMCCKVEAASVAGGGLIDVGATDNLCRLLNLRC